MNVLIADDEPLLLEHFRRMLTQVAPDMNIVAQCADGDEVQHAVEHHSIDIAFLDIRMPGCTGLEVAKKLPAHIQFVFVTAYDQYAIQAFEQGAQDYLLKPIESTRLLRCLERLRAKHQLMQLASAGSHEITEAESEQTLHWIHASTAHSVLIIDVNDVHYFRSDTKYTRVRTQQGEAYIRMTIKELAKRLNQHCFWQVHRGAIINVRSIDKVVRESDSSMYITLKTLDEHVPVSQTFSHRFKSM